MTPTRRRCGNWSASRPSLAASTPSSPAPGGSTSAFNRCSTRSRYYLPSPLDRPPVVGTNPKNRDKEEKRKPDPKEPFCGLVFKAAWHPSGHRFFIRVYSGTMKPNMRALERRQGCERERGQVVPRPRRPEPGTGRSRIGPGRGHRCRHRAERLGHGRHALRNSASDLVGADYVCRGGR